MKSLILVGMLCFGGGFWQYYSSILTLPASDLAFTDVAGDTHQLTASPVLPYVIVPWIDNCPFSARTLSAVEAIVTNDSAPTTDIYGFYINPKSNDDLRKHTNVKTSRIVQSAAQEDYNVIMYLDKNLFRKSGFLPGDVYVVDTNGNIQYVATRDLERTEVLPRILAAIQR